MGFDLSSIGSLYSGQGLSAIAKRSKVKQSDVAKVLAVGLPALVGGMNRNAAQADGAESLSRALTQHESADISNPGAFLATSDLKDGKKIVNHVFGGDQTEVVDEISRASGVSSSKVSTILALAAPLLLSMLGQQNSASNTAAQASGAGGSSLLSMLGGLLGMGSTQQAQSNFSLQNFGLQNNLQQSYNQQLQQQQLQQQLQQQQLQQQQLLQQQAQQNYMQQLLQGTTQQQSTSSSGLGLLGSLLGGGSSSSSLAGGLMSSLLGGGSSSQGQTNFVLDQGQSQQQNQQQESSGLLSGLLSLLH